MLESGGESSDGGAQRQQLKKNGERSFTRCRGFRMTARGVCGDRWAKKKSSKGIE
jgi:hypothetical protein